MVMFWHVTSLDRIWFVSLASFAPTAGPSLHFVRFEGSAFWSFGFTASSVYAVTGRSSMRLAILKRSTRRARSINRRDSKGCGSHCGQISENLIEQAAAMLPNARRCDAQDGDRGSGAAT